MPRSAIIQGTEILNAALGGAGTRDFSATVQDVALKELYATLAALVTPELLAWARDSFASSHNASAAKAPKKPGSAELLKSTAAPALAFYAKTRSLMREAGLVAVRSGDSRIFGLDAADGLPFP